MNKTVHRFYIGSFFIIGIAATVLLALYGFHYYTSQVEERYFQPHHLLLKPSGIVGHGIGILGSLMMIVGVAFYMIRKRGRRFHSIGILKYWLEFHIFLCTLGPVFILYHTAFKFGGIVSISFWCMVAVVLSGVIGRFIYLQIPHSISGQELSMKTVISRRIGLLRTMQKIFRYWHIIHLPFAIVMFVIMFVHIAVTIAFGSRWIF